MADYRDHYAAIRATGADVVAISVDSPEKSAELRRELELPFTILSDDDKRVVKVWNVLNRRERGGIAKPAIFIVDSSREVLFESIDNVVQRVTAADVVALLERKCAGETIHRRAHVPRLADFKRALRTYFR